MCRKCAISVTMNVWLYECVKVVRAREFLYVSVHVHGFMSEEVCERVYKECVCVRTVMVGSFWVCVW